MIRTPAQGSSAGAARQPIDIGGLCARVGATMRRHWRPYAALSLLLAALELLPLAKAFAAPAQRAPFEVVVTLLRLAVATVVQAGMTFATVQAMEGKPFAAVRGIDIGLRRFLPYLGTTIVYLLAISLGALMLLVPGLLAVATLSLAPALCVVENTGPLASQARSRDLTRGNRWRVLAVDACAYLAPFLASVALQASSSAVGGRDLVSAMIVLALSPVYFALPAVMYEALRRIEDVAGPAGLAEVFA